MAVIGDIFHAIGGLFGGGQQQAAQQPLIQMPKAAPAQAAPQQMPQPKQAQGQGNTSFLASAALPNYGGGTNPNPVASNPGGKSLLGQ